MPGPDPQHWLHRFTADEWLRAAMRELGNCKAAFERRASRPALASARRAAGMAWNAVLATSTIPDDRFGRSYADHLRALAAGETHVTGDPAAIPDEVRDAAKVLMDDPIAQSREVVQILTPKHDSKIFDAAETIAAEAYTRLARRAAATGTVH